MELYFLRHGKAAELGEPGAHDDFNRALTEKGIKEMEAVASALAALGVKLDAIFTSPLVRARETAEIVARRFGMKKQLVVTELLAQGCNSDRLRKLLTSGESASVMVVGHEPDFSRLVGNLIGRGGASVEMKKGAIACVETDAALRPGGGVLQWLAPPKMLCERC